jgi:phage regulator Rha-like protein
MELSQIHQKNLEIRGQKVMLDFDLAILYEVETRVLKQAVRRNLERFPIDFMFELNEIEIDFLVSQFVIPSKSNLGGSKPFAFTEHGVTMLSSILNSKKAININIQIIRAFIELKKLMVSQNDLLHRLKQLEQQYDKQFDDVFEAINYLLKKDSLDKQLKERGEIGYKKTNK